MVIIGIALFYLGGMIVFVACMQPSDALDGAMTCMASLIWPLFLLGWLVSRPFDWH